MPESQPNISKGKFMSMLESKWQEKKFVCVGLDPEFQNLPKKYKGYASEAQAITRFNIDIIDATADIACSYKPNSAYYEKITEGFSVLKNTISYIKKTYPEVPVIYDGKRGDTDTTNEGYAATAFDVLEADAATVHGYMGKESLKPYLNRRDNGIIIMAANSNKGSGEIQDLPIGEKNEPLYKVMAGKIADEWNYNGNCIVTAGATYPQKITDIRSVVGDMPILILGVGAQKGNLNKSVKAGKDSKDQGIIINSSRGIIYASKSSYYQMAARREARRLNKEINEIFAK
jgi:orotidine-5'-phosphate decarboxylase